MKRTMSLQWGAALMAALSASPWVVAQDTTQNGSLVTNDDKGISGDRVRELLDKYIPTNNAHSTLIVLTQCYGGNMVDTLAKGRANTGVISATSKGEEAEYGGYDDDAAKGTKPQTGRTSDTVHAEGTAGKGAGETPSKAGATVPLDPVDPVNGPIKSRHILVYAGDPDGNDTTSDEKQLQKIKDNFAGQPNTDVTTVGGDGTGNWDHPATEEGLEDALKDIQSKMSAYEQFIMFVTDHGDEDVTDATCTDDGTGNYVTDPLQLEESVYPAMYETPDNVAGLTIFVPTEEPPLPATVVFGDQATTVVFDTRVDLDNDGIQGPGDGWEAWMPVDENSLDPNFGNVAFISNLPPRLPISVRLSSGSIPKVGSGGGDQCASAGCSGSETLSIHMKSKGGLCQAKIILKHGLIDSSYGIVTPLGECRTANTNLKGKAVVKEYPSGSGTASVPTCGVSFFGNCP